MDLERISDMSKLSAKDQQMVQRTEAVSVSAVKNPRSLPLSQERDRQNELMNQHIEEVAKQYHFDQMDHDWGYSLPGQNKTFLTMLHDHVTRVGVRLPSRDVLRTLDFGSGSMLYFDAYQAFMRRYGKTEQEKDRNIEIVAWESDNNAPTPGTIDRIGIPLSSKDQVETYFPDGFDVLTMFGCGPGPNLADPKEVDKTYGESIAYLTASLAPDGVLLMTSSAGGPKEKSLIDYLQQSNMEILSDESNEYRDKLLEEFGGFTHERVIIARKKPAEHAVA